MFATSESLTIRNVSAHVNVLWKVYDTVCWTLENRACRLFNHRTDFAEHHTMYSTCVSNPVMGIGIALCIRE